MGLIIIMHHPWSTGNHPIWKKKRLTLDCLRMRKAWGKGLGQLHFHIYSEI